MARRSNIFVTLVDRQRLGSLIEKAAQVGLVERRYLDDLEYELERATSVTPEEVPPDVITMNSTARLRDLDDGETLHYTLVYPRDADPEAQRISVLAPVGTALLGYRVGDVIEWPIPAGRIRLHVEDVVFQPERAGDLDR
jgi:regulator of nucleoside diphosphate kinase